MLAHDASPDTRQKIENYLYWLKERGLAHAALLTQESREAATHNTSASATAAAPHNGREAATHNTTEKYSLKSAIHCNACSLEAARPGVSWGLGPENADVLFIGDHPTREAASINKPFYGPEWDLLTKITAAMKLHDRCYFMNIIQCPLTPEPGKLAQSFTACEPFIRHRIDSIRPKVLVFLGKDAAENFLAARKDPLFMGVLDTKGHWPFVITHHPREMLATPALKRASWQAFQKVMQYVAMEP